MSPIPILMRGPMKPDEALHLLENYGGLGVPRLYAEMPRGMLQRLVDECARISGAERSEAALMAWAQQRMKQPNWQGIADKKLGIAPSTPDGEAEAAPAPVGSLPEEPLPEEPRLLSHRAILRPERLSTPRRRQAAFLVHFARCRSVVEAAARTGVDRRTAHRWREEDEAFDLACRERLKWRRETILQAAIARAEKPKTRPVLYRGRQIGHLGRANDRIVAALMWSAEMMGRGK